jgi:wobble nucleotide-excising tRNase
MSITSLTIKSVASYDAVGQTINNLKRLNFFFGFNGTGKSTVARYLYNLSLPLTEQSADYTECSQVGYNPALEIILVYDERFKKENFIDKNVVTGIFSLNQKNATVDAKIEYLEDIINKQTRARERLTERIKKSDEWIGQRRKLLVNQCFLLRDKFKIFAKEKLAYGGNKDSHYKQLRSLLAASIVSTTLTEITEEYKRLYEQELKVIGIRIDSHLWDNLVAKENELNNLLQKVIVGHEDVDIAQLIKSLNIAAWVEEGRSYLEKSENKCPFCQQQLEDKNNLIERFNQFFDKSYQDNIQAIKNVGNAYYMACTELKKRVNALAENTFLTLSCRDFVAKLNDVYTINADVIRQKLAQPNETKNVLSITDMRTSLDIINQLIEQNDKDAQNIEKLKNTWVNKCWNLMATEANDAIQNYQTKKKYIEERLKPSYVLHSVSIDNTIDYCKAQIETLRHSTVNTKEAVDNINKILKNVGFTDFSIEEVTSTSAATQYRLKRTSATMTNVYKSLSEGEKTFISFLYFYQLCIGTDDIAHSASKKKIIVIDDPVSSLDSQILFIVSSIVHKLDIQKISDKHQFMDTNINQIFVLTHNLYFYKEVTLSRRPLCKDLMHYKVYKPIGANTKIDSARDAFPTDDYTLMWESLKKFKNEAGVDETRNIMVSNVMRRIIDSYASFIGLFQGTGNPTWTSIKALSITDPIYIVTSSFISLINDESHGVSPFDSAYYGNVIRQDTSTLFAAFKLIFDEIGKDHYNMML